MPQRATIRRLAAVLALVGPVAVAAPALAAPAPQNIIAPNRPAGQDLLRGQRDVDFRFRRGSTSVRLPEEPPWSDAKLAGITPRAAALKALTELDSPKYEVREAASRKLLTAEVSDEEVYVLLKRNDLSVEQRARLLDAGQRRIMDAPRGALGIQMAERGDADGVNVTGIVRGMPAEGVLRPGDRIVQINDDTTSNSEELVHIVQNMRPGEHVRLVVMRGERDQKGRVKADPEGRLIENRVEVEMPLGSAQDLERMGDSRVVMRPMDGTRDMLSAQLRSTFPQSSDQLKVERRADEPLDPETHPDVAYAREMLARPRDATLDAGIRGMMQARLSQLEAAARAPSLTPQERAWMDSVVARFKQLMAEREPRLVPRSHSRPPGEPIEPPAGVP